MEGESMLCSLLGITDIEDEEAKEMQEKRKGENGCRSPQCEEDKGNRWLHLLRFCGERWCFGILVVVVVSSCCVALSRLPWTYTPSSSGEDLEGETEYIPATYALYFQITMILFGPLYIDISLTLMFGWDRITKSGMHVALVASTLFFGSIYALLYFGWGIRFWFYWLDIFGVIVVFAPLQLVVVYYILRVPHQIGVVLSQKQRFKQAVMVVMPDATVTIMSTPYMFLLLPVFFNLDSPWKMIMWRIVVHPIYFTATYMVARWFAFREHSFTHVRMNANLVLHTYVHHQTMGRVLVNTLPEPVDAVIMIVLAALQAGMMRVLAVKRDMVLYTLVGRQDEAKSIIFGKHNLMIRATLQNLTTALEFAGLFTAPLFIIFFFPYRSLFHVYSSTTISYTFMLWVCALGVFCNIIIDYFCTFVEVKYFKFPLMDAWDWIKTRKSLCLWMVYGSVTMGLQGLIWSCARVPRYGLCADERLCSCSDFLRPHMLEHCT